MLVTPVGPRFQLPTRQFLWYLGVGLWNTAFGYATFALFAFLLARPFPSYGYMVAGILSSVMSMTVAFLGYKWVVFKTKGSYLREWLKFIAVYASSTAIGLLLLPLLVFMIRRSTRIDADAPYVAAAILMLFNAIYNFVGNREVTFKTKAAPK